MPLAPSPRRRAASSATPPAAARPAAARPAPGARPPRGRGAGASARRTTSSTLRGSTSTPVSPSSTASSTAAAAPSDDRAAAGPGLQKHDPDTPRSRPAARARGSASQTRRTPHSRSGSSSSDTRPANTTSRVAAELAGERCEPRLLRPAADDQIAHRPHRGSRTAASARSTTSCPFRSISRPTVRITRAPFEPVPDPHRARIQVRSKPVGIRADREHVRVRMLRAERRIVAPRERAVHDDAVGARDDGPHGLAHGPPPEERRHLAAVQVEDVRRPAQPAERQADGAEVQVGHMDDADALPPDDPGRPAR